MLEIIGIRYLFDHIRNEILKDQLDTAYKVYVTDSLRALGEHKYLKKRYIELADRIRNPKKVSNLTADEIKARILSKLNGKEDETDEPNGIVHNDNG